MSPEPRKRRENGDGAGERRPLLGSQPSDDHSSEAHEQQPEQVQAWTKRGITIVVMCFIIVGLFPGTDSLLDVGGLEILEGIMCRRVHGDVPNPTEDPRCKDPEVQGDFARLVSISFTLGLLPGLTAVTWGVVAEKYGRKPVLLLSTGSLFAMNAVNIGIYWLSDYISVYWVFLSAFINLFGGGPGVFTAMAYTMVSEVTPEYYRANVYLYLSAAPTLGVILSGPLAYVCMGVGHWFTACMGLLGYVITLVIAACIPETIRENKHAGEELLPEPDEADDVGKLTRARHAISNAVVNTGQSLKLVFWEDKKLGLLVLGSLFADLGTTAINLLKQYAKARLDLQWREANLLLSSTLIPKVVLLLVIIPVIGQIVLGYGVSPLKKDFWIARICVVLQVFGNVGLGLSTQVVPFVLSLVLWLMYTPYLAALKSVLAEVAGEGKIAVVFAIIGLLDSLSQAVAGPLMAQAYRVGLRLGGNWLGLPFFISASLVAFVAVMMWTIWVSPKEKVADERGGEESSSIRHG